MRRLHQRGLLTREVALYFQEDKGIIFGHYRKLLLYFKVAPPFVQTVYNASISLLGMGVLALAAGEFAGLMPRAGSLFNEDAEYVVYGGVQGFGLHLVVAVTHWVLKDGADINLSLSLQI